MSASVANMKVEDFEVKALASGPNPLHVRYWYIDDMFTVLHQYAIEEFTNLG